MDPDQMASSEASWLGSKLFSKKAKSRFTSAGQRLINLSYDIGFVLFMAIIDKISLSKLAVTIVISHIWSYVVAHSWQD